MTVADSLQLIRVRRRDPLARTVLSGLAIEYSHRYGGTSCHWFSTLTTQAVDAGGAFLVAVADGVAVAGGAYRRIDEQTAELTCIWTSSTSRRRGLARRMLVDLEADIAEQGHRRAVVTTGPREPEAHGLYLDAGYRPLAAGSDADRTGLHGFDKDIPAGASLAVSA
ncbi:acetyltransferase (GNAT) family protein [Williamsia limnetica]|uniref:Acetyltransferase (GNAT) family protein n=1 Tax=Williamsia limnetica TaxID=882452 RepID=A0A318RLN8_WILLI|nr:GNAT family N-acetyltransferase [Williamsia limnetica]PYE15144.1 acetyltransferase (GNAT) family protein [Williamsia limnetica]